jgi:hypothetical protein
MKNVAVVFTSNNARILKNPDNLNDIQKYPNALINPDLSNVINTAPHHWKVVEGKIVPMDAAERLKRDQVISGSGADNSVRSMQGFGISHTPFWKKPWFLNVCIALVAMSMVYFGHDYVKLLIEKARR